MFLPSLLFCLNPELNLFVHVAVIGEMCHWHSPTEESAPCPRICLTRNSMTHFFRHCSFRSKKKQGTDNKFIPFLRKFVASSVLVFLSHEFGSEFTQLKETKFRLRKRANHDPFSTTKKDNFSLILDQKFTITSSKPILIEKKCPGFTKNC